MSNMAAFLINLPRISRIRVLRYSAHLPIRSYASVTSPTLHRHRSRRSHRHSPIAPRDTPVN